MEEAHTVCFSSTFHAKRKCAESMIHGSVFVFVDIVVCLLNVEATSPVAELPHLTLTFTFLTT